MSVPPASSAPPSIDDTNVREPEWRIDEHSDVAARNVTGDGTLESPEVAPGSCDHDVSAPAEAHHQRGLEMARAHRWNWAQRELEFAARIDTDDPTRTDLETVRSARRYLRALKKRPRDAQSHIMLGKCYFELDMGEDAEREFQYATTIAPDEPEPHYFLALEYCYRGMIQEAERSYERAQDLVEGLPPFSALLSEYENAVAEETD